MKDLRFFHNLPTVIDDEYHVAIVTPAIHYCMGGLEITIKGEVNLFFLKIVSFMMLIRDKTSSQQSHFV